MEEQTKLNKIKDWHIFTALGLILISVPFFTRSLGWDFIDFSETGQIGDTIGGITAPFISGLAAYLVFIAFKAQIKANEYIREQNNLTKIQFEHNQISEQIEKLKNTDFDEQYRYLTNFISNNGFVLHESYKGHDKARDILSEVLLILTEIRFIDIQLQSFIGEKYLLKNNLSIIYRILYRDKLNNIYKWIDNSKSEINHRSNIIELIIYINRLVDKIDEEYNLEFPTVTLLPSDDNKITEQ